MWNFLRVVLMEKHTESTTTRTAVRALYKSNTRPCCNCSLRYRVAGTWHREQYQIRECNSVTTQNSLYRRCQAIVGEGSMMLLLQHYVIWTERSEGGVRYGSACLDCFAARVCHGVFVIERFNLPLIKFCLDIFATQTTVRSKKGRDVFAFLAHRVIERCVTPAVKRIWIALRLNDQQFDDGEITFGRAEVHRRAPIIVTKVRVDARLVQVAQSVEIAARCGVAQVGDGVLSRLGHAYLRAARFEELNNFDVAVTHRIVERRARPTIGTVGVDLSLVEKVLDNLCLSLRRAKMKCRPA